MDLLVSASAATEPVVDETVKNERKKKAKLFLDLIKRNRNNGPVSSMKPKEEVTEPNNATCSIEEPAKKKRRRFDVKPEDMDDDEKWLSCFCM